MFYKFVGIQNVSIATYFLLNYLLIVIGTPNFLIMSFILFYINLNLHNPTFCSFFSSNRYYISTKHTYIYRLYNITV